MANKIVHWELMGEDPEKLTAFYSGLFDWTPTAVPGFENYSLIGAEEAGVGGAIGRGMEEMPTYLTMYIEVEDITDHLAKIEGSGGKAVMPRTEIPGTVTFALFSDPAGNLVGLVEAEIPAAE